MHSDRGSQYCSIDYQNFVHAHGFIISMSRKGNCWDNAPMECFWGKMKQECLNDQHFKTREEAKKAVFEYIRDQLQGVIANDQLSFFETTDPFTGEKYKKK